MRTRMILTTTAAVVTAGALLGWLTASGRLTTVRAQNRSEPPGAGSSQLPKPDPEFKGKVGETLKDSTPSYPPPLKAPKGAPNVLVILLDDVGFGHTSTFGGTTRSSAVGGAGNRTGPGAATRWFG
jgi:hypothetical protein